jgi:hypothetical protein
MIATAANSLWLAGCLSEFARFHRATRRVADEQQRILLRTLARNADTDFGREHGFSSIRSIREFQQRVPLRDYDDYSPWIGKMASGGKNVLTRDPVHLFEPTSGSTSASKLIPYTATLQREFQRGIHSWIADLFLHDPNLLSGQAYWSVSPAASLNSRTPTGIPIGFEDDSAYVAGWQRRLLQSVLAVPSAVLSISNMDDFRYITLLFLLRSGNLKLISVWNPTFLSLILDRLPEWSDGLARDIERGTIRETVCLPRGIREYVSPDSRRALELREAMRASTPGERHARIWPELRLISCWTDANASSPAAQLATQFPRVRIQGKGLIATEGFVSFPLSGREGAALAVRSHFMEFLSVDSTGEPALGQTGDSHSEHPRLAHELERGEQYAVVLTTGGGLYRYQLRDIIEVIDYAHECPIVRFVGRQDYISDWFGEKLNEAHVSRLLQAAFSALDISPSFAMLACDTETPAPGYVLYIDSAEHDELLDAAAATIEAGLRENFHYRYARELGQLAPLRVFRARGAAEIYQDAGRGNGQRAGGIKPLSLDRRNGWSRRFQGQVLAQAAGQR